MIFFDQSISGYISVPLSATEGYKKSYHTAFLTIILIGKNGLEYTDKNRYTRMERKKLTKNRGGIDLSMLFSVLILNNTSIGY